MSEINKSREQKHFHSNAFFPPSSFRICFSLLYQVFYPSNEFKNYHYIQCSFMFYLRFFPMVSIIHNTTHNPV